MKTNLKFALIFITFFLLSGFRGDETHKITKDTLIRTKWYVDYNSLAKEIERISSKIKDKKVQREMKEALEQMETFRSFIQGIYLDFTRSGYLRFKGLPPFEDPSSSTNKVKWYLKGKNLYIEMRGDKIQKMGLKISGSTSKMTLTLFHSEILRLIKENPSGEDITEVKKRLKLIDKISLSFRGRK